MIGIDPAVGVETFILALVVVVQFSAVCVLYRRLREARRRLRELERERDGL